MADNVLFESGDNLDEANLLGAHAKTNQTDYVVRGLGFAVDHTAETLDTGSGAAIIETSNNEAYILETIDARSGLALATTTGTNHVFLSVDDTTDANDISITVKDADTPPSDPSLKIGTVDASADTSTELNRAPSITAGQVDIESDDDETLIETRRDSGTLISSSPGPSPAGAMRFFDRNESTGEVELGFYEFGTYLATPPASGDIFEFWLGNSTVSVRNSEGVSTQTNRYEARKPPDGNGINLGYDTGNDPSFPDGAFLQQRDTADPLTIETFGSTDVILRRDETEALRLAASEIRASDPITVNGDDVGAYPSTTTAITPGFDTWQSEDANRPVKLMLDIKAQTDGTDQGRVDVQIDESGGTTADYDRTIIADPDAGASFRVIQQVDQYLPPGAQYEIRNTNDPTGTNSITLARKITL